MIKIFQNHLTKERLYGIILSKTQKEVSKCREKQEEKIDGNRKEKIF